MVRLVESDYRKVLDVLYAAGEVDGPLAFPEPVLGVLRELIRCDVVTLHERSRRPERVLVYTGEPIGPLTPEVRAARRRLEHQDPWRPAEGARMLTDFVSARHFRRTEFYALVHRPLGVEHMLQLYLDPRRTDARLEFDRFDSDFGERDRKVLDLLLPHLRQLLRAATRRPAVEAPPPSSRRASGRSSRTSPRAGRTARSAGFWASRLTPSASTSRTRTRSSARTREQAP